MIHPSKEWIQISPERFWAIEESYCTCGKCAFFYSSSFFSYVALQIYLHTCIQHALISAIVHPSHTALELLCSPEKRISSDHWRSKSISIRSGMGKAWTYLPFLLALVLYRVECMSTDFVCKTDSANTILELKKEKYLNSILHSSFHGFRKKRSIY